MPFQSGPLEDATKHIILDPGEDPLKNMYDALGGEFEEKLLKIASNFVNQELNSPVDYSKWIADTLEFRLPDQSSTTSDYHTSENYLTVVSISAEEIKRWKEAYRQDLHLSQVLKAEEGGDHDKYAQYQVRTNGLIYFKDWNGNHQLVVPESLWVEIMSDIHNNITEATHGGYAKSSNRIASIYYWPQMSREIKKYVGTCDICQKNHTEEATPHTATGFAPAWYSHLKIYPDIWILLIP